MIAVAALIATSCSNDSDLPQNRQVLEMTPCWRSYTDMVQTPLMPRRLPTHYFENNTYSDDIGIFITSDGEEPQQSYFTKAGGTWRSMVEMTSGTHYQIYGYMPKDACTASIAMLDLASSYEAGCNMTLAGLKTISTDDVCLVVGVKQGESGSTFETVDAQLGAFNYTGQSPTTGNYVFLLFDHVFAAIGFQIKVDEAYSTLRTIKVKSISLKTTRGETVNASIRIVANNIGADPISTVTWSNYSGSELEEPIFTYVPATPAVAGDTGFELTTTLQPIGKSCMIAPSVNGYLTLHTVYDVYDKAGTLIREDQESDNKVPVLVYTGRHQRTILRLTVKPSYLYVLSDDDLNNPKFEITQ